MRDGSLIRIRVQLAQQLIESDCDVVRLRGRSAIIRRHDREAAN
jgi:hypothetical protein